MGTSTALTEGEREALYPIVKKSVSAYMKIERLKTQWVQQAKAEALREAADEMRGDPYRGARFDSGGDVGRWLRDRADHLTRTTT